MMIGMQRAMKFISGEIYHICNKSIASYEIFRNQNNSKRFLDACAYYNSTRKISFSMYIRKEKIFYYSNLIQQTNPQFRILAFCIMPDHYHLLLRLESSPNVSEYLGRIENSYSRYYNVQNNRKGPLWQSTFRATHIANNEQLIHVIRYIHLNPVTAGYVTNPRYWSFSSHHYYLDQEVLDSLRVVSIKSTTAYERFILNNIDYQKKLIAIRKLLKD